MQGLFSMNWLPDKFCPEDNSITLHSILEHCLLYIFLPRQDTPTWAISFTWAFGLLRNKSEWKRIHQNLKLLVSYFRLSGSSKFYGWIQRYRSRHVELFTFHARRGNNASKLTLKLTTKLFLSLLWFSRNPSRYTFSNPRELFQIPIALWVVIADYVLVQYRYESSRFLWFLNPSLIHAMKGTYCPL